MLLSGSKCSTTSFLLIFVVSPHTQRRATFGLVTGWLSLPLCKSLSSCFLCFLAVGLGKLVTLPK